MILKILTFMISFFCLFNPLNAQNLSAPKFSYLSKFEFKDTSMCKVKGSYRIIEQDGRQGLNTTNIHSTLEMKAHTLKSKTGTVSIWVMSLEDLTPYRDREKMGMNNPNYPNYPFLSDNPNPQNVQSANFKFFWCTAWHPSIKAQFGKGYFYQDNFIYPHFAFVSVSHFSLKARKWYQFTLTWNYAKEQYTLYANGILIGKQDQFKQNKMRRDSVNTSLFTGNPTLCYSDIRFYDTELSAKEVYSGFRKQVTHYDAELEKEFQYTYLGKKHKTFDFTPGADWIKELSLTFQKASDLDSIYVQGNPVDIRITNDGLLFETLNKQYTGTLLDSQAYVWPKKFFEGDLYVEYEFKILRPGGLSLLMVQASGMNGEDFMADYPLKTNGRMSTVFGEDVRNYHWEYYREMSDMSNYLQNSLLAKNPFGLAMSFSALDKPYDYQRWNKLQFLQIGNKLIGAINGIVMVEYTDKSGINNGPVFNRGHIAIRCMIHTKMLFRNLKVYNKSDLKIIKK